MPKDILVGKNKTNWTHKKKFKLPTTILKNNYSLVNLYPGIERRHHVLWNTYLVYHNISH